MTDTALPSRPLVPLPTQPAGVSWPTEGWPTGGLPAGVELDGLMESAFDPDGPLHDTYAVVAVQGGRLVYERYGGALPRFDGPGRPVVAETPVLSWSMAKSMLHAVVGMLVADGRLDPAAPADVPLWSAADDPRRAITLDHLLAMRDGLAFFEEYEDPEQSDVIQMLFGRGQSDMAAFAADRGLAAAPGSRFNYSTGTSMVVSGIVARVLGAGDPVPQVPHRAAVHPDRHGDGHAGLRRRRFLGGRLVRARHGPRLRPVRTVLPAGRHLGRPRLLPGGWVDAGRTPRSVDPEDGHLYGTHWWTRDEPLGTFWAAGHEGQYIDVCPALDLVLVRLGRTDAERTPLVRAWRDEVIGAFATGMGASG